MGRLYLWGSQVISPFKHVLAVPGCALQDLSETPHHRKIYPGLPSVKLVTEVQREKEENRPEVIKRPLVAVVGRPNVGKSTLVNRICDVPDVVGGITHDAVNVTHDRTYKPAEHTDDCGLGMQW